MRKRFLALPAAILGVLLCFVGCAPAASPAASAVGSPAKKTIVMTTYQYTLADSSFVRSVWKGLSTLQGKAQLTNVDSAGANKFSATLEEIVRQAPDLIWCSEGTGADKFAAFAAKYPSILFACVDAEYASPAANLTGLSFRSHEAAFLAGSVAAKTTLTKTLGFVGGVDEPTIRGFLKGFAAGAAYVDPSIQVLSRFTGNYSDPVAGAQAATQLYADGADVLFHASGDCGTGVISVAEEQNKWVIGADVDQSNLAPQNVLTSVVKDVGVAVSKLTGDYLNGSAIGGKNYSYGLAEGAVGLAPTHDNIDAEVYEQTLALQQQIVSGQLSVTQWMQQLPDAA